MHSPPTSTEVLPAAIRLINSELVPNADPKRQRIYARITRILAKAQLDIERRYRGGRLPAMYMGITPPTSAEDLREWGRRLRQRREEAGLTRAQLAGLSGVADSTIRNLETGRHKPTRPIIMRLQAVPALGMPSPFSGSQLASQPTEIRPTDDKTFSCNCWFAPEYDSIKMVRDMVQRLNSSGGHIEQTYLYIDPASAAAWCAISEQDAWTRAKALVPMNEIARAIKEAVHNQPLDIIGLGAGEARDEVRLVQSLFDEKVDDVRLFLLEISQPLLSAGYKHAAQVLGDVPGVGVFAIQGNFHNLPSYTQLLEARNRRRVVCMFGYTFSNQENEILFLRNSLCGFSDGDLLFIDCPIACASSTQPEEILKRDPRLSRALPPSLAMAEARQEEFFKGPFKRHVTGLRSIKLDNVLDLVSCPIPGSYAVDWRAHVKTDRGAEREFSIYRTKRYDPQQLDDCMSQNGWQKIRRWSYAEEHHPRMLCLYIKQSIGGAQPSVGQSGSGRDFGDSGGEA